MYFVYSRSLGMSFLSWFMRLPALVIGVFLYLLMIVLLVCQLTFGSSFSSGRFYFS